MEETARVILNKLKLIVDPTTCSTFSAYQQSAEIRQLWKLVESSIHTILTITSSTFSTNPLDASSQIISVLSASTFLSSIIHAIITTQRRLNKSDENIESIIKKEIQVILYHIQILKQDLNQSTIKAESAQEAIIHHTDILIDSLVAFSLSPSNAQFQVHPYKVSPSTSFQRRHSQPAVIFRKQSSSEDELMTKTLSRHQYNSNNSLVDNNNREKTDTVGKKFMRSIHSLKSRPAFHMTLLPSRHSVEPTLTEQPPKKKRFFYDHRIIAEAEEDPDSSDDNSMIYCWDDDSSSNHSVATKPNPPPNNPKPTTLRFILNGRRKPEAAATSTKRSSTTRGIKELFQSSPKEDGGHHSSFSKKKRESLSNLFSNNNNSKSKQLVTKDVVVVENMMQGSIYSSSASTSTSSAESMKKHFNNTKSSNNELNRPYLISPFAKKTNIHWTMEEEEEANKSSNHLVDQEEYDNTTKMISSSFESYTLDSSSSMEEDNYNQELVTINREKSRKRRSNGTLVAPLPLPPKVLSSTPMTRNNSSLPPLPTVENFLTIMNAPTSSDSSYFSARSTSSLSSSQSTLNSISLDDVTDNLAKAHITTAEDSFSESSNSSDLKKDEYVTTEESSPPVPPPKDHITTTERKLLMDPQDSNITNINNKQEKRSSLIKRNSSTALTATATDMKISTSDISNHHHAMFSPKSADIHLPKKRPPIPPRTSSMPLPPTPPKTTIPPPLPADAKKKASAYNRRPSTKTLIDENMTWSTLLGTTANKKDDLMKRAKLGRSLGAATPSSAKKLKKSDSGGGKLLKVTENGNVVLLFEMIDGKLQAIAGTTEKLFERLADETAQDVEYIDTYLMNHAQFIESLDLLNLLINRFHLEPSPGEYEYFKKWQFSIQSKVLNVVERWISFYYQDFKFDINLQKRLNLFLYNDSLLLAPQFKQQLDKIRFSLKSQATQFSDGSSPHQHLALLLSSNTQQSGNNSHSNLNFHFPFVNSSHTPPFPPVHFTNSPRRPSNGLFNLTSLSASPNSPSVVYSNHKTGLYISFASLESKDIARYLTLADYYLFKSIQAHGLLNSCSKRNKNDVEFDYVELMTKRANMLSHWVVHEICSITYLKPKRALLKKFIEIAKLCLELNNFHTCMIITMGLASAPRLKETWQSLSNRDMNTFTSLQKLLDVSLNMRHYRQKIQLAKSPSIPFLPVVLKDQTFFKENSTYSVSHPNLINFSKFRSIRQFVEKTNVLTSENYWFANDLTRFPFFPNCSSSSVTTSTSGQLDSIGDWLENRLSKVQDCYLHCDLLANL